VGLLFTKARGEGGDPLPPSVHSGPVEGGPIRHPVSQSSVAVDLVLLAAEDHGASHDAVGQDVADLWAARAGAGKAQVRL
jgi:hypothetical protein